VFRDRCRDIAPQQDFLSGVIICPAYWKGQRLKVNSLTSTLIESYDLINGKSSEQIKVHVLYLDYRMGRRE
jgi:hypothetical protein